MEAAYRRTGAAKQNRVSRFEKGRGDRKRLIQLMVSLALFCIVFFGRGVFPELTHTITDAISTDTAFAEVFRDFISREGGRFSALMSPAIDASGTELENAPVASQSIESTPVVILPLSQQEQHGLLYYRQNGLRKYRSEEVTSDNEIEAARETPVIVTAMAQPYNEKGESLPRNVSYERYELGLENTVVPVFGEVTSGFDYRVSPITGRREFHLAIDIAAPRGTEIVAFADGVVRYIGESSDFGLYLMIDHQNGVATFYAHCSKLLVQKGDVVKCGDTVALVGDTGNATGNHLHFTIEKDNIRLDPAHYVYQEQ